LPKDTARATSDRRLTRLPPLNASCGPKGLSRRKPYATPVVAAQMMHFDVVADLLDIVHGNPINELIA
jgi:hypothetical protein